MITITKLYLGKIFKGKTPISREDFIEETARCRVYGN